jgi:hypothetical protein
MTTDRTHFVAIQALGQTALTPNHSLNPDRSPAALTRRPLAAG